MVGARDVLTQWPAGGGAAGALIRAHDWASTPLGPSGAWPATLRGAIDVMLGSAFPAFVWWGEALVQVYNDAAADTIDPARHAATFAAPARDAWSNVWDSIRPVAEQIRATGKAVLGEDLPITPYRDGGPAPAWFTFSYSPLHGDDGAVAGLFITAIETTARVLAEGRLREGAARQTFLLRLSDAIRDLSDPTEIATKAGELLGTKLDVGRCGYGEVDEAGAFFTVHMDWTDGRMPSMAGRLRLNDFGPEMISDFRAGRTVRLDDPLEDPRTRESAEAFAAIGRMRGGVAVPLIREGRFVAALYAHQTEPRHWTDDEVALIQDVAERTWEAVERGRAESSLRDSEARYRSLFESIDEGFCVIEFMEDEAGALVDFVYIEANPALAVRSGVTGVLNRRVTEVLASEAEDWIAILGQVLRSGESIRFERPLATTGRLLELFAFRVEPASNRQVGVLFQDVTQQRQGQEHMRLMVNELNHRVKNNLAMIQAIAAQSFRNADSLADAQERFTARIMAMAQANDLLTGERWAGASLRNAVDQVVRSHCPDAGRCAVSGPEARLSPKTALALSLALHELATNALKYGAWSTGAGRVAVSWSVYPARGGERLKFEWREEGGPVVVMPSRRGFGSRLIERGLAAEMRGDVTLAFAAEGLVCTLDAPLDDPASFEPGDVQATS